MSNRRRNTTPGRMLEKIHVADITVGAGRRPISLSAVAALAMSMKSIGLRTPITVRYCPDVPGPAGTEDSYELITGAHRVEAARSLGWEQIDAFVSDMDETDARFWEIAENLHRADLSIQQRADQIAEWVRLVDEKNEVQSRQLGAIESKRSDGRGHRHQSGDRKAARDLNLSDQQVRRAKQIASIAPEAKEAARAAGIDDNQSKLLEVAAVPAEQQRQKVYEIVARVKPDAKTCWRSRFTEVAMAAPSPEDRAWAMAQLPSLYGGAPEEHGSHTGQSMDSPDHFENWWKHYPRKVDKGAARKAYERVRKAGKATTADLLTGAMRYGAERQDQDPKFTKHPTTWLNAEAWANEPIPTTHDGRGIAISSDAPPSRADSAIEGMRKAYMERRQ